MDFNVERDRIFLQDSSGKMVAEVTFPELADHVVNINHTFVDESLRGQGIAGKLLEAAAQKLQNEGKKAYPTCSFAVKWFEAHPEYSDLRIEKP